MSHVAPNRSSVSASRGSVMDVRPRRTLPNAKPARVKGSAPATTNQTNPAVANPEPASADPPAIQKTAAASAVQNSSPPVEGPAQVADKPPAGLTPELLAQATSETAKQEEDKQKLLASRAKNRRRGPVIAITVAIMTAVSLTGLAVYAYMDSQKTPAATNLPRQNAATEQSTTLNITPEADMSAAEQEIDSVISETDDAQEIPATGLDEQSLGL